MYTEYYLQPLCNACVFRDEFLKRKNRPFATAAGVSPLNIFKQHSEAFGPINSIEIVK
jgi:hypothetical protein